MAKIHVSIVAIPDAMFSTLSGIYDVLNAFTLLSGYDNVIPESSPFQVDIVGPSRESFRTASGLALQPQRTFDDLQTSDVVIVPSVAVQNAIWETGRYPVIVQWLQTVHAGGAILCSACSGVLLLAETGLLDGKAATVHWAFAGTFRQNFPQVLLRLEKMLVIAGEHEQFVMSGASASWHDLVLYLVARFVGPAAAQAFCKFFALEWHRDGQTPYLVFEQPVDHQDAVVKDAQTWLACHFAAAAPVAELVKRSGIPERSFKRRFSQATGYSPIQYVQHLRIEAAKRRLERSGASVEQISWQVGYQDSASFRRLFKRIVGVSPGDYRRKFSLPRFGQDDE
ncbi:GlxA family transcriptional regulator [Methylomonas sp. HYX-M1]|uniref:GlxA family transcriptional regulator n=1 Tax=Methylomonas sp. HYX-M1 TaxID=3139307 RepID=UPI00345C5221